MSTTNINSLNDDCLRLILGQFTLTDYPLLLTTCTRWCTIIKQICTGKRSLLLFQTRDHVIDYYAFIRGSNLATKQSGFPCDITGGNVLIYDEIKCYFPIEEIAELFPQIRKLVCHVANWCLSNLLPKWSSNLEFVCLFMAKGIYDLADSTSICPTFDSMSNLRQLHLFYLNQMCCPLAILPQLEHFTLLGYTGDIVPILSQLGPNCRQLWLGYVDCSPRQWNLSLQINPHLRQLTHLTFGLSRPAPFSSSLRYRDDRRNILNSFCDNLRMITFLDLRVADDISLDDLFGSLSTVSTLTELSLDLNVHQFDLIPFPNLEPLQTLKQLHLILSQSKSKLSNNFFLHIPRLFPSIERFTVQCLNPTILDQFEEERFRDKFSNLKELDTIAKIADVKKCQFWKDS